MDCKKIDIEIMRLKKGFPNGKPYVILYKITNEMEEKI